LSFAIWTVTFRFAGLSPEIPKEERLFLKVPEYSTPLEIFNP
jgi:hypothetical protein